MAYSHCVMRLGRTIISALLAFWMPLCCCQIGAIAGTGAPCCAAEPPAHPAPPTVPGHDALPSCCAPKPAAVPACCATTTGCKDATPTAACDVAEAEGSCCGAEPTAPAGESCTCCSTKAPAPAQESIDDLLPLDSVMPVTHAWASLALAHDAGAVRCAAAESPPPLHACGALPWPAARPSDRCAQLSVRTT